MSKEIPPPNYTQIPNAVLDRMGEMDNQTLRVVLALCRQTFGWQKRYDKVSVTNLVKMTGMSRQGVQNGIEKGMELGFIDRRAVSKMAQDGYFYRVKVAEKVCNVVEHPEGQGMQRSSTGVCNVVERKVCNVVEQQKKELKKQKERECEYEDVPSRAEPTETNSNGSTLTQTPTSVSPVRNPPTQPETATLNASESQRANEFIDASMEYLGKTLDWQMHRIYGAERRGVIAFAQVQVMRGRTPHVLAEFDRKWPMFCRKAAGETTKPTLKQFTEKFDDVLNLNEANHGQPYMSRDTLNLRAIMAARAARNGAAADSAESEAGHSGGHYLQGATRLWDADTRP